MDSLYRYNSVFAYGQSKLANILHANELSRQLKVFKIISFNSADLFSYLNLTLLSLYIYITWVSRVATLRTVFWMIKLAKIHYRYLVLAEKYRIFGALCNWKELLSCVQVKGQPLTKCRLRTCEIDLFGCPFFKAFANFNIVTVEDN